MNHQELIARYSGPVLDLARCTDPLKDRLWNKAEFWPDYSARGIGPEHVPDLIRMATDVGLVVAAPDEAAGWGQIHAARALAQLGTREAAAKIVEFACWLEDDDLGEDWQLEEFPVVMAMLGPDSANPLHVALDSPDERETTRVALLCALSEVAKHHPVERERAVRRIAGILRESQGLPELASFAAYELVELNAVDALDDIRIAFQQDLVDYFVVDWFDVCEKFGIEEDHPEWCRMSPDERVRAKASLQELEEEWRRMDERAAAAPHAASSVPAPAKKLADKSKKKKAEKQKRKDRKRNRRR